MLLLKISQTSAVGHKEVNLEVTVQGASFLLDGFHSDGRCSEDHWERKDSGHFIQDWTLHATTPTHQARCAR